MLHRNVSDVSVESYQMHLTIRLNRNNSHWTAGILSMSQILAGTGPLRSNVLRRHFAFLS
jgi:hypothetical protein